MPTAEEVATAIFRLEYGDVPADERIRKIYRWMAHKDNPWDWWRINLERNKKDMWQHWRWQRAAYVAQRLKERYDWPIPGDILCRVASYLAYLGVHEEDDLEPLYQLVLEQFFGYKPNGGNSQQAVCLYQIGILQGEIAT